MSLRQRKEAEEMPITDILTKNADFYPNDVSLVEINPKLEDNRNMKIGRAHV